MYYIAKEIYNNGLDNWVIIGAQQTGQKESYNIRLDLNSSRICISSVEGFAWDWLLPHNADNLTAVELPEGAVEFWRNACIKIGQCGISQMKDVHFAYDPHYKLPDYAF